MMEQVIGIKGCFQMMEQVIGIKMMEQYKSDTLGTSPPGHLKVSSM